MEAREEINSQLKKYQETMDKLNYKISLYDEAMRTGVLRWNMSKEKERFSNGIYDTK